VYELFSGLTSKNSHKEKKKMSKQEYQILLAEGNFEIVTSLKEKIMKKNPGETDEYYSTLLYNQILSAQRAWKKKGKNLTENMLSVLEKDSMSFLLKPEDVVLHKPQGEDPGWHATKK
jgi:hypothetical protein